MIIFIVPKNSGLKKCREIAETLKGSNSKIISVRGEDVPLFVSKLVKQNKGVIGITGEDLAKEFLLTNYNTKIRVIKKIPWNDKTFIFKKPTLCLLGPKDKGFESLPKNLKIAVNTKYRRLAKKYCLNYLENKGYKFKKIYTSGTTEELFSNEIVDLVIDVVCTGKSAEQSGLKIYNRLFLSDIVILGNEKGWNLINKLDFKKQGGLIPTIVKDEQGNVLMLAYSNKESLKKTLETRNCWYFSRKRKKLWLKGETSGSIQELIDIKTDCDKDSLLFIVKQRGDACHLKNYSCFKEEKKFDLEWLYKIIYDRIKSKDKKSYSYQLSVDNLLLFKKIIEESRELINAKTKKELIWESADLIYFTLVLLVKNNISLQEIYKENQRRNKETLLNKQKLNI